MQIFRNVPASKFARPPGSILPLRLLPQGSWGFYIRAHRALLPPHAPDMLTARIQAIGGTGDLHPAGLSALSAAPTTCSRITSATERAIVIAGSGRPRVLGPTERQAPISRACPWRLGRSPLENDRESPLSPAHVVPIYLVGLRRSLARLLASNCRGTLAIQSESKASE